MDSDFSSRLAAVLQQQEGKFSPFGRNPGIVLDALNQICKNFPQACCEMNKSEDGIWSFQCKKNNEGSLSFQAVGANLYLLLRNTSSKWERTDDEEKVGSACELLYTSLSRGLLRAKIIGEKDPMDYLQKADLRGLADVCQKTNAEFADFCAALKRRGDDGDAMDTLLSLLPKLPETERDFWFSSQASTCFMQVGEDRYMAESHRFIERPGHDRGWSIERSIASSVRRLILEHDSDASEFSRSLGTWVEGLAGPEHATLVMPRSRTRPVPERQIQN